MGVVALETEQVEKQNKNIKWENTMKGIKPHEWGRKSRKGKILDIWMDVFVMKPDFKKEMLWP